MEERLPETLGSLPIPWAGARRKLVLIPEIVLVLPHFPEALGAFPELGGSRSCFICSVDDPYITCTHDSSDYQDRTERIL